MSKVMDRRDLMIRWKCSLRTVVRFESKYRLEPITFTGLEPVFDAEDVRKAEQRRLADRRRAIAKLRASRIGGKR